MNNLRSNTKIKYFYLVPKTEFYQLKLPRNRDVLEVFFGLRDQFGELEPKKNIALKIYDQICPIYKTGPFPMKKKQVCLENILKVHDTYRNVTKHIKEYDYDKPSKSISKFKESLDQLCDLSAKNIFEQIMKDSSRSQSQKVQDCDFLREQILKVKTKHGLGHGSIFSYPGTNHISSKRFQSCYLVLQFIHQPYSYYTTVDLGINEFD